MGDLPVAWGLTRVCRCPLVDTLVPVPGPAGHHPGGRQERGALALCRAPLRGGAHGARGCVSGLAGVQGGGLGGTALASGGVGAPSQR